MITVPNPPYGFESWHHFIQVIDECSNGDVNTILKDGYIKFKHENQNVVIKKEQYIAACGYSFILIWPRLKSIFNKMP